VALLEKEAVRFAESLDDYEHVSAQDIGGADESGYWLVVRERSYFCAAVSSVRSTPRAFSATFNW
jgi:hypothetical protein